jgi:hypothetical protein
VGLTPRRVDPRTGEKLRFRAVSNRPCGAISSIGHSGVQVGGNSQILVGGASEEPDSERFTGIVLAQQQPVVKDI